jgi:FtsP/CotA-like multicopper oxidase with cupredoxin domain
VLVLSGWDLDGDGRDELVTFNGIAGAYGRHPITVPVGEPVRLYVVNMLEHEPVASFHLHAQTFDVFRSGTSLVPDEHTDLVSLTQGERVVLEFTLPVRGRYMFHPHQTHLAERGAMGWFAAV